VFEHWEPAMTKVLERKNLVSNTGTNIHRWEYVVEVQATDSEESFRTSFKDPIGGTAFHFVTPVISEVAAAEVDWKSHKVKWDLKAPGRMSADPLAGKHAQDARMKAALDGEPAPSPAVPSSPLLGPFAGGAAVPTAAPAQAASVAPVGGPAAELASLAALHQQGVLTVAQFEQAKNAVIGLTNP
jgi:hypothetical protein